jgi:hypothetical protein
MTPSITLLWEFDPKSSVVVREFGVAAEPRNVLRIADIPTHGDIVEFPTKTGIIKFAVLRRDFLYKKNDEFMISLTLGLKPGPAYLKEPDRVRDRLAMSVSGQQ